METANITDKKLIRFLWLSLAITMPLFAVPFLRINIGVFHIALPMIIIGIILFLALITLLKHRIFLYSYKKRHRILLILLFLFLLWHLISFLFITMRISYQVYYAHVSNTTLAIKNIFRLLFGFFTFWSIITFFPRDSVFIKRFFILMFWAMGFLLFILLYKYIFIFHATFLGVNLYEIDRTSKNQLAYFLACILPFALFYFYYSKKKFFSLAPLFLITLSIIYISSRGAWVSAILGLIFLATLLWYFHRVKELKIFMKMIAWETLIVIFSLGLLARWATLRETKERVISIYKPSAVTMKAKGPGGKIGYLGRYTYKVRGGRLIEAWRHFLKSPLWGVGLGNTEYHVSSVHNDYFTILLELGSVGLILYLGILFYIWLQLIKGFSSRRETLSWTDLGMVSSMVALLAVSMVCDNYLVLHYWIFLALYLVIGEREDFDDIRGLLLKKKNSEIKNSNN